MRKWLLGQDLKVLGQTFINNSEYKTYKLSFFYASLFHHDLVLSVIVFIPGCDCHLCQNICQRILSANILLKQSGLASVPGVGLSDLWLKEDIPSLFSCPPFRKHNLKVKYCLSLCVSVSNKLSLPEQLFSVWGSTSLSANHKLTSSALCL